jgi:hypothetical protein
MMMVAMPSECFASSDAAAYEKSVADLVHGQPLSNRPNELSFLVETGRQWCAHKAVSKESGTPEERLAWLVNFKQTNPNFQSLTSGEAGGQGAAVEQANKYLCP